jgi:hypothetical protein
MLSNRIRNLAPPPRSVPLTVIGSAMFGATGAFGAIFLIAGLGFTLIFTRGYRPVDDFRLVASKATARGVITSVSEMNATENDVEVYEYGFTFTARNERKYAGYSYTTGRQWSVESAVTVEYVADDPSIARIQGARTSLFSPWVLFVLIFPAVGAALFGSAAIGGLRQAALLRYGVLADAHITASRPTGTSVNDVPLLNYSYEIRTGTGEIFDGSAKSFPSDRIGDEESEPALYLPSRPGISTLVDAIPSHYQLEVDESTGRWISQGGYWKLALYILACAVSVALAAYILMGYLGIIR